MKINLFIVSVILSSNLLAQQHQNGNMYLHYNISNGSYYNIDQEITPLKLANGTFWALTFGFNEQKDGGYIGIQTDFSSVGKGLFIFSIWNAIDAKKGDDDSYISDFGGEGVGKSCRISIPLVESHSYKLRIWQLETTSNGTYWGAWIKDQTEGIEHYLGKIKTKNQTTLSNSVSNFVEYYGGQKACDDVPSSKVVFKSVKTNCNDDLGTCKALFNPINYSFGECVKGVCNLNKNNNLVIFGGN